MTQTVFTRIFHYYQYNYVQNDVHIFYFPVYFVFYVIVFLNLKLFVNVAPTFVLVSRRIFSAINLMTQQEMPCNASL